MDSRWLEDFLSLAETRSFSRSAQERHITQPAFSRRIRSLEAWAGAELVDRGSYPPSLTPAGRAFREQASEILRQMNDARALARGGHIETRNLLQIASGHTLAATYFPKWMTALQSRLGRLSTRMIATNVHDAVLAFVESGCDLLLCFNHPKLPILPDSARHDSILLGQDWLLPVSVPDGAGKPRFGDAPRRGRRIPLVAYSPGSYLGRAADLVLQRINPGQLFEFRNITDRSEIVKALTLEGGGMAWLPEIAIARELEAGHLVRVAQPHWAVQLEIRVFRSRANGKPVLNRVWSHLLRASAGAAP